MAKPAFIRIRIEGAYWAANSGFLGFSFKDSESVSSDPITTPESYLSGPRTPIVFGSYEGIFGDVSSADIDEQYVFVLPSDRTPDDLASIQLDWMNPYDGFTVTIELSADGATYAPAGAGEVVGSPSDIPLSWTPAPAASFWTDFTQTREDSA